MGFRDDLEAAQRRNVALDGDVRRLNAELDGKAATINELQSTLKESRERELLLRKQLVDASIAPEEQANEPHKSEQQTAPKINKTIDDKLFLLGLRVVSAVGFLTLAVCYVGAYGLSLAGVSLAGVVDIDSFVQLKGLRSPLFAAVVAVGLVAVASALPRERPDRAGVVARVLYVLAAVPAVLLVPAALSAGIGVLSLGMIAVLVIMAIGAALAMLRATVVYIRG